jgi:[acyl-carrier-protein] S-malonyltransferase
MIDWSATAFVFPGQASQEVGMGRDIVEQYSVARDVFDRADDLLGYRLSQLCFEGPEEELNDTVNTQPALFVCSIAILRTLESVCPAAHPAMVAGHSLGELTALVAAGALSFEDGLRLVQIRGRLMKEAGERSPGAMAALLGLDAGDVREICNRASAETGGVVVLANDNCPGQLVISGDEQAIESALALAQEAGARRAVRLAVSIASHSPLMESISEDFRQAVSAVDFRVPEVAIYGNVNAAPLVDVASIQHELSVQLIQPVRWTELVQAMIRDGARRFIEIGSKDVLSGLIRRIDRDVVRVVLNDSLNLHEFIKTPA